MALKIFMLRINLVILLFCFALVACAPAIIKPDDWPRGIPPKSHYQQLYKLDNSNHELQTEEEYLKWVVIFFQGYNLIDGWQSITEQVLAKVSDDRYAIIASKMNYLGQLISGEWAKLSPQRVIVNRSVSVWSEAIKIAADRNEIEDYIDNVINDIDALFARKLDPDLIQLDRYYENTDDYFWQ